MKLTEAIIKADELRPNIIGEEIKVNWVFELESEIAEMMRVSLPINKWPNEEQELLMPFPKDNIYVLYLCAHIDNAQEDTELYANDITIANTAISEAKAWWWRNNKPPKAKGVITI